MHVRPLRQPHPGTPQTPIPATRQRSPFLAPDDRLPLAGVKLVRPRRCAAAGAPAGHRTTRQPEHGSYEEEPEQPGQARPTRAGHRARSTRPLDNRTPHWCGYTRCRSPREGRFRAMFAPRLLVSPDLVPRAVLIGLAPARSARPSVPSRSPRPLRSGPADGITQRYIYRIAQLGGSGSRPQVHARYIGGTREVHRVADTCGATKISQGVSLRS